MEIDSSEVDTFQVTKEARVVMTNYFKNVKNIVENLYALPGALVENHENQLNL